MVRAHQDDLRNVGDLISALLAYPDTMPLYGAPYETVLMTPADRLGGYCLVVQARAGKGGPADGAAQGGA